LGLGTAIKTKKAGAPAFRPGIGDVDDGGGNPRFAVDMDQLPGQSRRWDDTL
jgi:hypothetical protein